MMMEKAGSFLYMLFILFISFSLDRSVALQPAITSKTYELLPTLRTVELKFQNNQIDLLPKDVDTHAHFTSLLQRRDGITLYGRDIVYEDSESKFASVSIRDPEDRGVITDNIWDATLLLEPQIKPTTERETVMLVAMNRFSVREECRVLFEQRWAERKSQLVHQPGFLTFMLLRKNGSIGDYSTSNRFNYASCTIWASHQNWMEWRNGIGRYSHVRPEGEPRRTPVSEWLFAPASPIFWDGINTTVGDGLACR